MCLTPRLPEIKANLDVSTTYFGFLLSTGSIGALLANLSMGHFVHRLGVYKVLIYSSTIMYVTLGILIELHSAALYLIMNIICGYAWASYHISINAQALHRQFESGINIIPMLHGLWSAGAVTTAFIAILVSSHISLNWHIFTLIITVYILKLRSINRLKPTLLQGNEVTENEEILTYRQMLSSFSIDWVVSLGFMCALLLEVAIGDWVTILARQEFGVSKSIAAVPYFLFMGAMIIGRTGYNRFKGERSDKEMVKPFAVMGGTVFLTSLGVSLYVKESSLELGFVIFCSGFFVTGLGISFIGPLFFGYASARSDKPSGVVVAELGAINQILTFVGRGVISIVAGATTLPIALIIPGLMLICVTFFVAAASQPRKK